MILTLLVTLSFVWLFVDDIRGNPLRPGRQLTQRRTLVFGVEIPTQEPPLMRDDPK